MLVKTCSGYISGINKLTILKYLTAGVVFSVELEKIKKKKAQMYDCWVESVFWWLFETFPHKNQYLNQLQPDSTIIVYITAPAR